MGDGVIRIGAGGTVFREGEEAIFAYLIVSGRVELVRARVVVGQASAGEVIGEDGVLTRSGHSLTARASEDTVVQELDYDELIVRLTENPLTPRPASAAAPQTPPRRPALEIPDTGTRRGLAATLTGLFARNAALADTAAMRRAVSIAVLPLAGDAGGTYRRWVGQVFAGLAGVMARAPDTTEGPPFDVYVGGELGADGRTLKITAYARGVPDSAASVHLPRADGDAFYTVLRMFVLSLAAAQTEGKEQILASLLPKAAREAEPVAAAPHTQLSPAERADNLLALAKGLAVAAAYSGKTEGLEKAVACYSKVLADQPSLAARVYMPLGLLYQSLGERKSDAHLLELAVTSLNSALGARDREEAPEEWAAVNYRMGQIYVRLGLMEGSPEDFDDALRHYRAALRYYTQGAFPMAWAQVAHDQALAYHLAWQVQRDAGEGEVVLGAAADLARQAMRLRTRAEHPLLFAASAALLGNIVLAMAQSRSDARLLEQAEQAYLDALDIYRKNGKSQPASTIAANLRRLSEIRADFDRERMKALL
ncbi:hypothetical protein FACS1894186_4550 [Alphaproteobacteria bacterium]|nr:hypothetical protein FACS1894186_4550 [Alphaproteobacteria bacterium]